MLVSRSIDCDSLLEKFIVFSKLILVLNFILEITLIILFVIGLTDVTFKDKIFIPSTIILVFIDMIKTCYDFRIFESTSSVLHFLSLIIIFGLTIPTPVLVFSHINDYSDKTIFGCYILFCLYGLCVVRLIIYGIFLRK